jgi:hypothetical protein
MADEAEKIVEPVVEAMPAGAPPSHEATDGRSEAKAEKPEAGHIDAAQGQTAQIPVSEPLPSQSEPFKDAQDKPLPPPSSTSTPTTSTQTPNSYTSLLQNTSITRATQTARELWSKALASIRTRKQKRLDHILKFLEATPSTGSGQEGPRRITNDEVEKLVHVSDATATRYLAQLEREGKIRRVGTEGSGVHYIKA